MSTDRLAEIKARLEAYKHWGRVNGGGDYADGPGPDLEFLLSEVERLSAEVERLDLNGIHTCHSKCRNVLCVMRRENERLNAVVEAAKRVLNSEVIQSAPFAGYSEALSDLRDAIQSLAPGDGGSDNGS